MNIEEKLQEIIQFCETENITKTGDLKNKNRSYYNWIFNNKLSDQLPFVRTRKKGLAISYEKKEKAARLQEHYDLERLLPYLERYAEKEGTSVEEQCRKYYLLPEWREWKENHPEYAW